MSSEKLDAILEVDPEETKTAIEEAAEIIHAEAVDASNTPVIYAPSAEITPAAPEDPHNKNLADDTEYAREQIKELIDMGRSGLQGALELAESGENPRAFEVVATMLQAVVNANRELINIHKVKKDAEKEVAGGATPAGGTVNIDKAVFVGRASDLLRELAAVKKQQAAALAESKTSASES